MSTSPSDVSDAATHLNQLNLLPGSCLPVKFTLFSKLPIELQLHIWKYGTENLEPRLITFDATKAKGSYVPSLLHTNSETRSQALKRNERVIAGTDSSPFAFFFDYDADTIILNYDRPWLLQHLHKVSPRGRSLLKEVQTIFRAGEVQRVALQMGNWGLWMIDRPDPDTKCMWRALERQFPKLEEVTFLIAQKLTQVDMNDLLETNDFDDPNISDYARELMQDYEWFMEAREQEMERLMVKFLETPLGFVEDGGLDYARRKQEDRTWIFY